MKLLNIRSKDGFILVWTLLILIVVTLLGAAGISTSLFEKRMAANEAIHKRTFYEADGGSENGLALLVENVNCITGFSDEDINGVVQIRTGKLNFWLSNNEIDEIDPPSDLNRDFWYPANYGEGPHTNARVNGRTTMMTGANLPMLAGYEGKGKAMGSDGAFLEYDIKIERIGERNSRSLVHTKFRLDNQFASYPAGTCIY